MLVLGGVIQVLNGKSKRMGILRNFLVTRADPIASLGEGGLVVKVTWLAVQTLHIQNLPRIRSTKKKRTSENHASKNGKWFSSNLGDGDSTNCPPKIKKAYEFQSGDMYSMAGQPTLP